MHIHPDAKTGAHHHGHLESVIYVLKGRARMRWGEKLEFTAEAGPGDFIYVPPWVPHQEVCVFLLLCWLTTRARDWEREGLEAWADDGTDQCECGREARMRAHEERQ